MQYQCTNHHITAAVSQHNPNAENQCTYPQFLNTVCDGLMTGGLLVDDVYDVTHELRELGAQLRQVRAVCDDEEETVDVDVRERDGGLGARLHAQLVAMPVRARCRPLATRTHQAAHQNQVTACNQAQRQHVTQDTIR